jgi:hypothetical protein
MTVKLFRDPVYDYIAINDEHRWILDLINTPEMQRLRFISQLGLCNYTYPGATHSRFSHSLGVFHLMQQVTEYLKKEYPKYFREGDEDALLAASLLHDLGHPPLSHVTEKAFGNHEQKTVNLILDGSSHIYQVLSDRNKILPKKVASLIDEKPIEGITISLWQKSLISSQLDMDRLDYLRRDALCSGAEYGNYDYYRILHTIQLKEKTYEKNQKDVFVTWPKKTRFALEEYLFSRFYMYQSVYFHKTTRGFECFVRSLLERAKELASTEKSFKNSLLPPMTLLTETNRPDLFLRLTDYCLFAQISFWTDNKDPVLKDISRRILTRTGLASIELTTSEALSKRKAINQAEKWLDDCNFPSKYYFIEDNPNVLPYRPYSASSEDEERQSSVTSILLYDESWGGSGFKEITEVPGLQRLKAITEENPTVRYFFPKEYETQIKEILR